MENKSNSKLKVFALNSNLPLAEKIAKYLEIDLGDVEVSKFKDGETCINIGDSVRGAHVYIVQSTSAPVDNHLMELLIMIDALKRASAQTINVVLPYYGYARQDRKARPREPITAKLVANLLERAGTTRLVVLDLHADQVQGFFDIPMDHLLGGSLLADYFIERGIVGDSVVVVAPNHSGVSRARRIAKYLSAPIAIVDKRKSMRDGSKIVNIIGDVDDKICILVDDIVDSGETLAAAAEALIDNQAKEVYAAATHAVLSGNAVKIIEDSAIKKLVVTDSIYQPKEKQIDKIDQVTVSELFADAISRVYHNKSVSPLFEKKYEGRWK